MPPLIHEQSRIRELSFVFQYLKYCLKTSHSKRRELVILDIRRSLLPGRSKCLAYFLWTEAALIW